MNTLVHVRQGFRRWTDDMGAHSLTILAVGCNDFYITKKFHSCWLSEPSSLWHLSLLSGLELKGSSISLPWKTHLFRLQACFLSVLPSLPKAAVLHKAVGWSVFLLHSWRHSAYFLAIYVCIYTLVHDQFSSVQFSSVARPPCPSPSPGVHSDSRPSSPWCHPSHLILGRPMIIHIKMTWDKLS